MKRKERKREREEVRKESCGVPKLLLRVSWDPKAVTGGPMGFLSFHRGSHGAIKLLLRVPWVLKLLLRIPWSSQAVTECPMGS